MAEEKREEKGGLEGRIERLEQMLGPGTRREAIDLSADEINAYIKVRDVIAANYGEFCGINDCFRCMTLCKPCMTCSTCSTCRICRFCDVECICTINPGRMSGGIGDFTRFGG